MAAAAQGLLLNGALLGLALLVLVGLLAVLLLGLGLLLVLCTKAGSGWFVASSLTVAVLALIG